MTVVETGLRRRAASLEELREAGRLVVALDGHTICLLAEDGEVFAVDNRCPHMGFPLHRGSVADGILTCHWHHARFDLCTGGTFDQWADELRRFPVEVEGDDVYVDLTPPRDRVAHQRKRLQVGLERDISLVIAKAAIVLVEADPGGADAFQAGLDFGVRRRGGGWFRGLTTLSCLMNLVPRLEDEERAAALYHGLSDVASDSAIEAPRFPLEPLPGDAEPARLGRWFRGFVEVRDAEGAERALVSAVRAGASQEELADMLFAAATDHRYLDGGPHARLRQQGPGGARRRRLGAGRARARRAARAARLRRADGGGERLAQPGRSRGAARGRVRGASRGAGIASFRVERPARAGPGRPLGRGRGDPRGAARGAAGRRPGGRARLGGHLRGGDPDRALPDRPTSSATGTRHCTRSRSQTQSSRASAAPRRPSSCAGSSTRP